MPSFRRRENGSATARFPFLFLLAFFATASLLWSVSAISPAHAQTAETVEVTDLAGRTVRVKKGVQRMILGEGRQLYGLAVLERDNPFKRVVGWRDDLKVNDPDAWRKYRAKFPEAEKIADFGNPYTSDFSVEKVLALDADVVVLDLGNYFKAQESGTIAKLEKAGIPVVFIDWREDPSQNTVPSLILLGRIMDREKEALAFADFYLRQIRLVYTRVGNLKEKDRPLVFMERAAGYNPNNCCSTWGATNFGKFVEEAGGRNWGSRFFSSTSGGDVNVEKVIADDPDFYLMTGANWSEAIPSSTAAPMGYEATDEKVQASLKTLTARPGLSLLRAVREKHVMVLYHQFYNSPYSFVAVQAVAKMLHPDRFKDVDPQATWTELHAKFLPVETSGLFWATMK
ncbi:ABC transporter substrate-binding protein [Microvirga sp. 17 mud 1-3]|uniref:ABC transporter substrate-binding protein n=1 Tax=Microvirga sp. 17 mud 1-3 TaxID=2082949 RepID=UPI000D6CE733|nr:ABC transporter substrate-binding protein [Microvirga sp. 17 mud 1-3]AWM86377.1 ABC transporter substrate-binding protein [Microvirga sp. 17 mud 1-3]